MNTKHEARMAIRTATGAYRLTGLILFIVGACLFIELPLWAQAIELITVLAGLAYLTYFWRAESARRDSNSISK